MRHCSTIRRSASVAANRLRNLEAKQIPDILWQQILAERCSAATASPNNGYIVDETQNPTVPSRPNAVVSIIPMTPLPISRPAPCSQCRISPAMAGPCARPAAPSCPPRRSRRPASATRSKTKKQKNAHTTPCTRKYRRFHPSSCPVAPPRLDASGS